jgi:GNAT superfamily N-acetyltransferase
MGTVSELTSDYWGITWKLILMLWFCILITRPWLADVSRIRKDTLEIKRMFVLPEVRGRGLKYLRDLEQWGVESGFSFSVWKP